MKITKGRLKEIITEEMSSLNRNPYGGTSLSEAPADQLALQLQNDAKGAAMGLLDASKEFAQMPSHEPASSVASFVEKQANLIVDAMVKLEQHLVGSEAQPMDEDLATSAGEAYGLLDAGLAQAERWANELVGIEEYISDPDIAEVAVQSTQELVSALNQTSGAAEKLIAAVDAELGQDSSPSMDEADEGGAGVHDIFNMPEPEAVEPTGNPKEDALRQIVAQSQAAKVDGVMVDGFTASAIVQILDALKPEIKEKYLAEPIQKMASMAMKMAK